MSAFSYFDKDGSGYITIDEIQVACKEFGLDDIHIDEMVKEIDQDNVSFFSSSSLSCYQGLRTARPLTANLFIEFDENLYCRMDK